MFPHQAFVRAAPGSYESDGETYPSLRHFLAGDRRRVPSRERDVGLHWVGRAGHIYRAAWVVDTGELVLVQIGAPETGGGHVEVLAHYGDERDLEVALEGWERVQGQPLSAEWLRARATHSSARTREGVTATDIDTHSLL
jgi:hypothetical protein